MPHPSGVRTTVGITFDRTPPEAWERALGTIAPPSEHLSWLKLVWEPGDRWQPVQRWMIWHMLPATATRPDVLAELKGPHPRSTGHWCGGKGYCACLKPLHRWVGGPCRMIDRLTWELYQQTGCYGRRWWTIQGTKGGHRHRLSDTERRVLSLTSGMQDTPAPGALPYADFDRRTFEAVLSFDKVRMWTAITDFAYRSEATLDAEERAEAEAANLALAGWIDTQVEAGWEQHGQAFLRAARNTPVIPGLKDRTDYEAAAAAFVHDV